MPVPSQRHEAGYDLLALDEESGVVVSLPQGMISLTTEQLIIAAANIHAIRPWKIVNRPMLLEKPAPGYGAC